MKSNVSLYSPENGEIDKFLTSFYNKKIDLYNELKYMIFFDNPTEMTDLIAAYVENNDKYKINMWISLDKGAYINITKYNADRLIRYIFERFPY